MHSLLDLVLAEFIAKHKPLSAADYEDGLTQELTLDPRNVDTIMFYLEKDTSENHKHRIKLMKKLAKMYDDRPENERKWFVF